MISSVHRPTQITVNLEAIRQNIQSVQAHIPEGKQVFAVVKANAYGHGAVAVSKAISHLVDGYCVSNIDEGIELRQAGIVHPILILGVVSPTTIPIAIKWDLTVTVASLEWVAQARSQGICLSGLSAHLKIDSGMGRIGVRTVADAESLLSQLRQSGVLVTGIFTHFATADEANRVQFDAQLSFFKQVINSLNDCPKMIHASNSATSLWHADTIFSAVRLGIVIYGLNPSGELLDLPYPIKPALSLESELVHVKTVEPGTAIGYGATYSSQKREVVGTVPIGYADGWTRDLQGFSVLINGEFCEIVGRVSMDQITIRLPRVYPIGSKVTLIGESGDAIITATTLAQKKGTINYEVICLLSDRIPRRYINE